MVKKYFGDVTDIDGVEAVVIFDNQNKVLDSWAIPKYNPSIFTEVGETFLHVFGLLEHLSYNMEELVVPFDRGLVFAVTRPKFYIVIIARLAVEVPLIRLAVNVNMRDFLENRKTRKLLKKLTEKKFFQIKSITLDDVEKIMLENILEDFDGGN